MAATKEQIPYDPNQAPLNLKHKKMVPQKLSITFEPPQIGLLYKKSPEEQKKQLFVIQLNGLIFLGDPDKITRILFKKHSDYLSPNIVSFNQVRNQVIKLLEYLQSQLIAYEEEERAMMEQGDQPEEMTPQEYLAAVRAGYIKPTAEELAQLGLQENYDGEDDDGFDDDDLGIE